MIKMSSLFKIGIARWSRCRFSNIHLSEQHVLHRHACMHGHAWTCACVSGLQACCQSQAWTCAWTCACVSGFQACTCMNTCIVMQRPARGSVSGFPTLQMVEGKRLVCVHRMLYVCNHASLLLPDVHMHGAIWCMRLHAWCLVVSLCHRVHAHTMHHAYTVCLHNA